MGTDIHCVVEGRDESGKWVCLNPIRKVFRGKEPYTLIFEEDRNYDFFIKLCGVRGTEEDEASALVKTYSIPPEDASTETVEAMMDRDYHSHGVCDYKAFVKLVDECNKKKFPYYGSKVEDGILRVFGWDYSFVDSLELRVVFAFDS